MENETIEEKWDLYICAARTLITSVQRADFCKHIGYRNEAKEALLEKERKSKEKGKTNKRERRKKISFVGLWTTKGWGASWVG